MSGQEFYNAGTMEQVAINLFYGWGYNFYKLENHLRSDDLLVRSKVCGLLGALRASLETIESSYRQEFLPAPSRLQPRPDPIALKGAQTLESLAHRIGALEGTIRALPVPENDRMTQRYRTEAGTLASLMHADQEMVGRTEMLRASLLGVTGSWILENKQGLSESILELEMLVEKRQGLLAG